MTMTMSNEQEEQMEPDEPDWEEIIEDIENSRSCFESQNRYDDLCKSVPLTEEQRKLKNKRKRLRKVLNGGKK